MWYKVFHHFTNFNDFVDTSTILPDGAHIISIGNTGLPIEIEGGTITLFTSKAYGDFSCIEPLHAISSSSLTLEDGKIMSPTVSLDTLVFKINLLADAEKPILFIHHDDQSVSVEWRPNNPPKQGQVN